MKKRIFVFTLFAVLCVISALAALLLAACVLEPPQAISDADSGAALDSGMGRVLISIAGLGDSSGPEAARSAARTLLPWNSLKYKLEFTRQGETEPALTKTIASATVEQDLEAGDYTLTAGSLALYPLSSGADPTFINLSAELCGSEVIPSGYYRIRLSVYGSSGETIQFAGTTGVVHIADSLGTPASYPLAAGDFAETDIAESKLYFVENSTKLNSALTAIKDASGTAFTILVKADFSSIPLSLADPGYDGKTINLRSADGIREISLSSQGSLFTVGAASSEPALILRDIALKGMAGNNAALLRLDKGWLIMESGTSVTGNEYFPSSSSRGGGVFVWNASFAKTGGVIYGSNETGTGSGGNPRKNAVSGAVAEGAAVFYYNFNSPKYRNTTVGMGLEELVKLLFYFCRNPFDAGLFV